MPRGFSPLSALAVATCATFLWPAASRGDSISIQTATVALDAAHPSLDRVGALRYRGGLALRSPDERFGGWSGLRVGADGQSLLAISDEGYWLRARIRYDGEGRLAGLAEAELGELLGLGGAPLHGKNDRDAESLELAPDGAAYVGFEHWHRIWHYPAAPNPLAGTPRVVSPPPGLDEAPPNGSLESLALRADGSLLAITEELDERTGCVRAWIGREGRWETLRYRLHDEARPSDATFLPSGDLLVLERGFSPLRGAEVRLRRVPGSTIAGGATLDGEVLAELRPPLSVDNFEGVSARRGPGGETLVYLISDDNYSVLQRSLLFLFALEPPKVAP